MCIMLIVYYIGLRPINYILWDCERIMLEIVEREEEFDDFVEKNGGQGLVPFEIEPKESL